MYTTLKPSYDINEMIDFSMMADQEDGPFGILGEAIAKEYKEYIAACILDNLMGPVLTFEHDDGLDKINVKIPSLGEDFWLECSMDDIAKDYSPENKVLKSEALPVSAMLRRLAGKIDAAHK